MQPSDRSCPSSHSSSNPSLYPCSLGRTFSLFFSQCQSLHLCQEILASNFLHDFGAVISPSLGYIWTSLVAQTVKRLSTVQETRVRSLGREDPLEKEMAIHFSTIAWNIPWTEKPGRLQSIRSQRVGHDWVTSITHSKSLQMVTEAMKFKDSCSLEEKLWPT